MLLGFWFRGCGGRFEVKGGERDESEGNWVGWWGGIHFFVFCFCFCFFDLFILGGYYFGKGIGVVEEWRCIK